MASQLRVDKIVPVDGVPTDGGGGIVQVVYAEDNNADSLGAFSNNGADSPVTVMSASITPKFSTSKILVMCKGTVGIDENSVSGAEFALGLSRTVGGSTTRIGGNTQSSHFKGTKIHATGMHTGEAPLSLSFQYLDSPSTTSAVTYNMNMLGGESKTYYKNRGDSSSSYHFPNAGNSTITLMEVSA
mgnify:CR=1 FL=1|tara:strand:+ start:7 stop:564 length:558 start_codon:yes stop_codon:yes gene_type:complete